MVVRYIDTSWGDAGECLGTWLDQNVVQGIREFRCQTGYFAASTIAERVGILQGANTVRFVLGANSPEQPSEEDIRLLLPLLDTATITVVQCAGALFHPKVIHIVDARGTPMAYVGSANLTAAGLGRNVEAGVLLTDDDAALSRIAESIDAWSARSDAGVHHVRREEDIAEMVKSGVLLTEAEKKQRRRASATAVREDAVPRFSPKVLWRAPRLPGIGKGPQPAIVDRPSGLVVVEHWCKQLARADAQQPGKGKTNVTGKLRLAQAHFPIDHTTWFHEEFFGPEKWVEVNRRGKPLEECHVVFRVTWHGEARGNLALLVDYGEHRVAKQGNVSTVLSWGTSLSTWLREESQVDNWVVLERDDKNSYSLRIEKEKPDWAP